jgi:hypothetical protein
MRTRWLLLSALLTTGGARADVADEISVRGSNELVVIPLDNDDDDENGILDFAEPVSRTHFSDGHLGAEIRRVILPEGAQFLRIDGQGVERVPLPNETGPSSPGINLYGPMLVRGTSVTAPGQEPTLRFVRADGTEDSVRIAVAAASFLDATNRPIDPRSGALGVSHEITNGTSLPRGTSPRDATSDEDDENVRIEVWDPTVPGERSTFAAVESFEPNGTPRARLERVELVRESDQEPFRSGFLRLVGDAMDTRAPGVASQVLRVGLRDLVRIRYTRNGNLVSHDLRVGRPGDEDNARAAREATLRVHVMRVVRGGATVVGRNDAEALSFGRNQIAIANEIWLQCFLGFGNPAEGWVNVEDPPPASMISIGDENGLRARGGGTISLKIGRQRFRMTTRPNATPTETATELAAAITRAGFAARVFVNPPTEFGAGPSADVLVRDRTGALVTIEADGNQPFGTDARQKVTLGVVDLTDGITEFNNMNASSGTLEERSLLRSLSDDDPSTVDIFIVNSFSQQTRIGEAFVRGDGGSTVNSLILDRNGLRAERSAWTQSHELGHILLDMPYHPDNVGPDRPWLLMDADASSGFVTGPKRITWDECHRVTEQTGLGAATPLLRRIDARPATPSASITPGDFPGYAR